MRRRGREEGTPEGTIHPSEKIMILNRSTGFIAKIGREPLFGFGNRDFLAGAVILDLLSGDTIDGKVARFGVSKIVPAHTGRRHHRKALSQGDPDFRLSLQEIKECPLFRVIGTGRIAWCGPDASIGLLDQIFVRQFFGHAIAPILPCLTKQQIDRRAP